MNLDKNLKLGIIGLGYVGLPLAVEFSKKYLTFGFDINSKRVSKLNKHIDDTLEVSNEEIKSVLISNINSNQKNGLFIKDEISY